MNESPSPLSPDPQRRSRIAHGVLQLNRQASRTGRAAVGTVLAAALISGVGSTPAMAWETVADQSAVTPRSGGHGGDHTGAAAADSVTQRLGAVAYELDQAVNHGEVTLEQALAFFAQIQARVIDGDVLVTS
ncbi:MAG: hypothetical protein Q4C81_02020 [Kocuria sp.]|nr:hypothetical protein [Kocuria sp.]